MARYIYDSETGELNLVAGLVDIDTTPTEGSAHAVQSGGTFNAIKAVSDDVDELSSQMQALTNKLNNEAATRSAMGAKNLIPFDLASIKAKNSQEYPSGSWNNNEWTINGVTFAIQDDNTVVATGSNTSNSNAQLDYYITIKGGVSYIANGCPSGGSASTYRIANYCSTSPAETFTDIGNGVAITRAADTAILVHMQVRAGYTIDGQLVFKPMVRLATDSDATYQPYAKTNLELAEDINAFVNNVNVNGCKNRFVLTMEQLIKAQKSNGGTWNGNTYTFRGVTFTCNTDDSGIVESVTVNGTATGKAGFRFSHHDDADVSKEYYKLFSENSYMVTGAKTVPRIIIDVNNGGTWVRTQRITSDSEVTLDLSGGDNITVYIEVPNGETANNITIYPMLCLKSDYDIDPTYEPYSKTNRELTLDSVTWDDLSEVGAVNYLPKGESADKYNTHYTVNADGTISVTTGTGGDTPASSVNGIYKDVTLKAGTYKLSGCPSGGKSKIYTSIESLGVRDIGNGAIFTIDSEQTVEVTLARINNTTDTYNGLVFKPMISPVSYNGSYVPYAKTNKELTDCVAKNYSFSVSFDGEKTVRDVLNELETMIENYITNNPSRLLVVLNIRSFALDMNCPVGITSNNIPGGFAFGGAMYMSNGANKIHAGSIRTSNSQLKYSIGDAVTDLTLTKPTSGNIQARCILF